MDVKDGPSGHKQIWISPSRLSLLLRRCQTAATVQPPRTRDRPQTYRRILSLALPLGNEHTTTDTLVLAQEQAIRPWRGPRHPEYSTLAKRTRNFYDGQWVAEGKPSVSSIAAAGFYYDGKSQYLNFPHIFKFKTSSLPRYTLSFIRDPIQIFPYIFKILHFKYRAHI